MCQNDRVDSEIMLISEKDISVVWLVWSKDLFNMKAQCDCGQGNLYLKMQNAPGLCIDQWKPLSSNVEANCIRKLH